MCNLTDNFMEDALFHQQLKQEYEHRMWCDYIESIEQEKRAYDKIAQQYFKDLEQYQIEQEEKEYREIIEWELINQL